MSTVSELKQRGIRAGQVFRNAATAMLYELAVTREGATITSSGALAATSGEKTGRSPKDKRLVHDPELEEDIWWGSVNIKLDGHAFTMSRQRAVDFLNSRDYLYVVDGFVGWDPKHRLKIRVVCALAYHALFMHNMLIRPSGDDLAGFGEPDFTILNAGQFPADIHAPGITSPTCVALSFHRRECVILGTQYAGEMKKSLFTLVNYLAPRMGVLSMHCSANEGSENDVSLFFGLSGTGKTTLSADGRRKLIGDDEHCWSDDGVFNIEGGCYAKCIDLSADKEPQIYHAIRFGTILENVVVDEATREVNYSNRSITENTRASYPVEFMPNAKIPCVGAHPRNIIFLTCDAFGVLPPIARLTPAQAMYHFMSGYTAKVSGTEVGITRPEATFSACFAAPFLIWHPTKYAHMLAERIRRHGSLVWLMNTGWTGGPVGAGRRIPLRYTRALIDAIHSGALCEVPTQPDPTFGFDVPTVCPGVPGDTLIPRNTWPERTTYDAAARKLAELFAQNFEKYGANASEEIRAAAPLIARL
jgi:phosphoenolpyruvate carboxykinase (ATP)